MDDGDQIQSDFGRRNLLLAIVGSSAIGPMSARENPSARMSSAAVPGLTTGDPVDVRQFGARCDGRTDDQRAVQRAVDACLSAPLPRPLIISGRCRIDAPLIVDRPVDQTEAPFRIIGVGAGAGFYLTQPITLFDSRLEDGTDPKSEYITFENIRFEAADARIEAFVMSGKFLRLQFVGCDFHKIRCLRSPKYAQEWRFYRCIIRRWSGIFFASAGGYDIVTHGCKFQFGDAVFRIADPDLRDAGCVGCSFHQDTYEGNGGPFLAAAIVRGLSVVGLYSEGNAVSSLNFDNGGANHGINISGCFFAPTERNKANTEFFDIVWGNTQGGYSSGNFSTGRLHDDRTAAAGGLASVGDFAQLALARSGRMRALASASATPE